MRGDSAWPSVLAGDECDFSSADLKVHGQLPAVQRNRPLANEVAIRSSGETFGERGIRLPLGHPRFLHRS